MANETANTETAANETVAVATPKFFLGMLGDALKAYPTIELFNAQHADQTPITSVEGLVEANEVPLAAMVKAFNDATPDAKAKTRGFKDRKEGAAAIFGLLETRLAAATAANAATEGDKLAAAVKPKKEKKAKEPKAEGTGTGKASPLAKKFWARSGNAISGRRLGGSGVGIQALQYIVKNPGCSTEDYIANSGGGRYVDLQYDLEYGNIVMLTGADEAARKAEIAELDKVRVGAEAAAAEKLKADEKAKADKKAAAEAEKKAKADKKAADDKAKKEKAEADAAALANAKAADDKAKEAATQA